MVTKLTTSQPIKVANQLRPVLLQLNRQLRRELAPLGITAGQAALLHAIRTHPGVGVRELAALEGISAPATTAHVDRLEAAGLVRSTRAARDRRRVDLELTEKGIRVLRSALERRAAWLAARVKRLDDDELEDAEAAIEPRRRMLG